MFFFTDVFHRVLSVYLTVHFTDSIKNVRDALVNCKNICLNIITWNQYARSRTFVMRIIRMIPTVHFWVSRTEHQIKSCHSTFLSITYRISDQELSQYISEYHVQNIRSKVVTVHYIRKGQTFLSITYRISDQKLSFLSITYCTSNQKFSLPLLFSLLIERSLVIANNIYKELMRLFRE